MEEQEKRQADRKAVFLKQLKEKINWVCSPECWYAPGRRVNDILSAGKILGFWEWPILSDDQCKELDALHTLKAYDELNATLKEMLKIKDRYPEIA